MTIQLCEREGERGWHLPDSGTHRNQQFQQEQAAVSLAVGNIRRDCTYTLFLALVINDLVYTSNKRLVILMLKCVSPCKVAESSAFADAMLTQSLWGRGSIGAVDQ